MMLMSQPQPNGPFTWVQEPWGAALTCTVLPAPHLFTSADVELREDAAEWQAVAASLGVTRERLLLISQVHGTAVAVARRGRTDPWARPEADIIISDDPFVAIGVRVADCAPILLVDRARQAVGAIHAGWRGAAAGAAAAGIRAMQAAFGTSPADVVAAIGPCLGGCCGEMGPEVVELFRATGHTDVDRWFMTGSTARPYLDLELANRDQLRAAGVPAHHIYASGLCTKTHHVALHSYRADGARAGRLLAAIRAPAGPAR